MGGGDPGKWWLENEIILPCIKFPTFAPFLFVRVERVGKLEGGGGLDNQISRLYQISHICTNLYIRVGRVGEWVGGGGPPRQSDIPNLYQISHICTILLCMYIRVGRVGEEGVGVDRQ